MTVVPFVTDWIVVVAGTYVVKAFAQEMRLPTSAEVKAQSEQVNVVDESASPFKLDLVSAVAP
jgi:hypothetical protein